MLNRKIRFDFYNHLIYDKNYIDLKEPEYLDNNMNCSEALSLTLSALTQREHPGIKQKKKLFQSGAVTQKSRNPAARIIRHISVGLTSIILAIACLTLTTIPSRAEDSTAPDNDPAPVCSIEKISATDRQKALAGQEPEKQLQVIVRDEAGAPVNNVIVRFEVKKGGGGFVDPVTGLSVAQAADTTDADGIAEMRFRTGPDTSVNKTYLNLSGPYATRGDLNIIEACLEGGKAYIKSPFTVYGLPGPPTRMEILPEETRQGDILSFAGAVAVSVRDANGNPVSNVNIKFSSSIENDHCIAPDAVNKDLKFISPDEPCLVIGYPEYDQCGSRGEYYRQSDADGRALTYVILGAVPRADYIVTAEFKDKDGNNVTKAATFHSTDVTDWVCNEDSSPGGHLVVFELPGNDYPNCGAPGDKIDLRAHLQLIIEEEKKHVIVCDYGQACPHIYGIKKFTTAFNHDENINVSFEADVVFNKDPGKEVRKGSLYTYRHTIAPGVETVPVTYTATIVRDVTFTPCETCGISELKKTYKGTKTIKVYGISTGFVDDHDMAVSEIIVPVNEGNLAVTDTTLTVQMNPSEYTPDSCFVIIYENKDPVSHIPVDIVNGRGTVEILRGTDFYENRTYTAGVLINNSGGSMKLETPEEERLKLTPVRAAYGDNVPDFAAGQ